jgi:flagellar protein FlgJ
MNIADTSNNVAFDTKSLDNLKVAARESSPESIKEVAKQFEAVFMNMLMKSMRAATPQEGLLDNDQTRTFTAMLDQQLSTSLSEKGLGLSDIIAKQLSKGINPVNNAMTQAVSDPNPIKGSEVSPITGMPVSNANSNAHLIQGYLGQLTHMNSGAPANSEAYNKTAADALISRAVERKPNINSDTTIKEVLLKSEPTAVIRGVDDFKQVMTAHADIASRSSGIPSHLMLGQAALESGWGKRQIKGIDGTESFNLFGIKANKGWAGKVVETMTTEYKNGIKHKQVEQFRAYDSYADSFKDFAKLMTDNPRYKGVMTNLDSPAGYAKAMQQAGYATDPNYAKKLENVIEKFTSS